MTPTTAAARAHAQAWVELLADDPEAFSALEVARRRLPAGRRLAGLRRLRLIELAGALPERAEIETLLHRSTRFYNPHKERCMLRATPGEPAPVGADERVVLVTERGGERRAGAERWWRHETGGRVEVREGTAWVLAFEPGTGAAAEAADAESLAIVRDPQHGLFCNPHSQDARSADASVPFPWLTPAPRRRPGSGRSEGPA